MRALLIDDHKGLTDALRRGLESLGFAVDLAENGELANGKFDRATYDAIAIDMTRPKMDALEFLQKIQKTDSRAPILVLACTVVVSDQPQRGAVAVRSTSVVRVHDLEIDTGAGRVRRAGRAIELTPREYGLLQFLASHRGQVVTRAMIWEHLWEHLYERADREISNVVDVYIRYLRSKIDKGFDVPLILTRRGRGYLLRDDE